jgi:hypothetical protein
MSEREYIETMNQDGSTLVNKHDNMEQTMNFTFLANRNTPQSIIDALETHRTTEFYNVPYSMTFNQITVKFRHQNTQLHIAHDLLKKQMHWLNEDFFKGWVGKNKRLSKDIETGIGFAVIGFAEIKKGNFHVHLLMRVPNGAVIDNALEERMQKNWRELTGSGTSKFSRYDPKKEAVISQQTIKTKTGTAELRDAIKAADSGWINYMTKNVALYGNGTVSDGWEFMAEQNGYVDLDDGVK